MPRGIPTEESYEEREARLAARQLGLALNSYRRMKAEAIQHLVAYKVTKHPDELKQARSAVELAEHARTVAAVYNHHLPALPAIPSPARRPS